MFAIFKTPIKCFQFFQVFGLLPWGLHFSSRADMETRANVLRSRKKALEILQNLAEWVAKEAVMQEADDLARPVNPGVYDIDEETRRQFLATRVIQTKIAWKKAHGLLLHFCRELTDFVHHWSKMEPYKSWSELSHEKKMAEALKRRQTRMRNEAMSAYCR